MTRTQIMTDLQAALAAIGPEAGYPIEPHEVRRGIHLAEQMNELPALCIFTEKVETTDQTDSGAERLLFLHVWGAAHAVGDDFSDLDALAAAVVSVLADPDANPHWARTSCLAMELYEGGAGDPLGLFDLTVQVIYETGLETL